VPARRAGANEGARTAQGSRAEIRDQLGDLVRKARAARLDTLAYVLEIAIRQANEAIGPED